MWLVLYGLGAFLTEEIIRFSIKGERLPAVAQLQRFPRLTQDIVIFQCTVILVALWPWLFIITATSAVLRKRS